MNQWDWLLGSLWKTNERYKTEKLWTHIELYEYISLFEQYKWYYKSENINGPFWSNQMKKYFKVGTINKNTEIGREPPLNKNENENIYNSFDSIYIYDIWGNNVFT